MFKFKIEITNESKREQKQLYVLNVCVMTDNEFTFFPLHYIRGHNLLVGSYHRTIDGTGSW